MTAAAPTSTDLFSGPALDLEHLAARAYVWGLGPVWGARIRQRLTRPDDPFASRDPVTPAGPLNHLGHQRRLSDPTMTVGVAPNVDTLYSLAWLDLDHGPFVLQVPRIDDRYYTFQIATADTECHLSPGQRTHGAQLPPLFLHGPASTVPPPAGTLPVASATRYLLVAGRIMVDPADADDVARVHDLQDRIQLRTWDRYVAGDIDGANPVPDQRRLDVHSGTAPPDLTMLHELGAVLRDWYPAPTEEALLASFAALGLDRAHGFDPGRLSPADREAVAQGLRRGEELVDLAADGFGTRHSGWSINYAGPVFGDDHLLRAVVAREQVYVVPPEEALYPSVTVDSEGRRLSGAHDYQLTFPAGELPPVEAFWSVTLYTDQGRLVANPLGRHAIGDRTTGLRYRPDGSLTIRIGAATPDDDVSTWLPAPEGPFRLTMRLYGPTARVLDGDWTPPAIERYTP